MMENPMRNNSLILATCVVLALAAALPATAQGQGQKSEQGVVIQSVTGTTTAPSPDVLRQSLEQRLAARRATQGVPGDSPAVSGTTVIRSADGTLVLNNGVTVPNAVLTIAGGGPKEKAAYLGVAATPVNAALREQLKLQRGIGVLVERTEKDSPAEQAGLKRYDVIEKIDDQWLINGQQLAVLIRMHKPADEVKLSVIRQGERQVVTAKLIEKEVAALDEKSLWGLPVGAITDDGLNDGTVNILFRQMPADLKERLPGVFSGQGKMNATISDEKYRYTITTENGSTHLLAQDAAGNVVYDGPVDTDEQIGNLPMEISTKVKSFIPRFRTIRPKPMPGSR
jgi:hypothetical protein